MARTNEVTIYPSSRLNERLLTLCCHEDPCDIDFSATSDPDTIMALADVLVDWHNARHEARRFGDQYMAALDRLNVAGAAEVREA